MMPLSTGSRWDVEERCASEGLPGEGSSTPASESVVRLRSVVIGAPKATVSIRNRLDGRAMSVGGKSVEEHCVNGEDLY